MAFKCQTHCEKSWNAVDLATIVEGIRLCQARSAVLFNTDRKQIRYKQYLDS